MMKTLLDRQTDNDDTRSLLRVLAVILLLIAALCTYITVHGASASLAGQGKASSHLGKAKSAQRNKAKQIAPAKNQPAPDFSLKDLSGKQVRLSDYKGKVVMVNFWATWCGPCHMETPWLVELHEQYQQKGLEIIGVSVDSLNEYDPAEVKEFATEHKINYPIVMGTQEMVTAFGPVSGIPTTILIDRQGVIRYRHRGLASFDELKEKVTGLL